MNIRSMTRRAFAGVFATAALVLFSSDPAAADAPEVLHIGYQKYGTLVILKARGALEQRLKPRGIEVKWIEFPSGPTLLEALNVGSIDYGTVGEAPPIFAQAAGADLIYIGNEPPAPTAEAIVVLKNSPIESIADLQGKKIALNKGSNVHYLLVKVLEKHGLKYQDVQTVFLPPADARAAFERGSVDAWVIWDPFLASAETQLGARALADGRGIVSNHQFYVASRRYAESHPEVTRIVLEELDKIDQWGKRHPGEVAVFLAPLIGLDVATVDRAAKRYSYGIKPVDDDVLAEQQKIADAFFALKLIPKKIAVKDAVLNAAAKTDAAVSKR